MNVDIAAYGAALVGIGNNEAVPITMHGEASGDQVLASSSVLGQGVAVAPGFNQASAFHQRLQSFCQLLTLLSPQVHLADQLLVARRAMRLPFNLPQDGLIGKHD